MGASFLFINALNSDRVAFKKDTADSGTTRDERTDSYAPKKENIQCIWALFFCERFLIYYFQTSYLCALEIERK